MAGGAVVNLVKDVVVLHLVGEVASVKLDLKDGFVEVLELGEGEDVRKEVEPHGAEVDVFLDAGEGVGEDGVMVEGQGGDIGKGEPFGFFSIGVGLYLFQFDKGVVGDGDDALAGVAVDVAVGAEFYQVLGGYLEAGFLSELA